MDGSHLPSDKRYVLLNKQLADLIEDINTEDLKFLIELLPLRDCVCTCRGRSHITLTTDDGRQLRLVGRGRHREPTIPDFERQFRV
jgi:hypothetical protein